MGVWGRKGGLTQGQSQAWKWGAGAGGRPQHRRERLVVSAEPGLVAWELKVSNRAAGVRIND